jgi:hypothetical protein
LAGFAGGTRNILFGARSRFVDPNPADLAIAGPTEFAMSVNHTTLNKLGLSLPSDLFP